MPGGDDQPEPFGPLPDPLDRVWSHPSELARAEPPRRRSRSWPLLVSASVVGAAITVVALASIGALDTDGDPDTSQASTPTAASEEVAAELAAMAAPSVVGVRAVGDGGQQHGSGVCVRRTGDDESRTSTQVVTADHLVAGARDVVVTTSEGVSQSARVVDADAATDLAVLELHGTGLPSLTLDRGNVPAVGSSVVAVAAGKEAGTPWVTAGVVSSLDSVVPMLWGVHPGVVEVDATMTPEAAGGAVLDREGRLVGMVLGASALGYPDGAVTPVDVLADVVDQVRTTGRITSGWIGVEAVGHEDGAEVVDVVSGSPAESAGLAVGDVIVAVDGDTLDGEVELAAEVARHAPGTPMELQVRSGSGTPQRVLVLTGSSERLPSTQG